MIFSSQKEKACRKKEKTTKKKPTSYHLMNHVCLWNASAYAALNELYFHGISVLTENAYIRRLKHKTTDLYHRYKYRDIGKWNACNATNFTFFDFRLKSLKMNPFDAGKLQVKVKRA